MPEAGEVLGDPAVMVGSTVLRQERERRRMTRKELAEMAEISAEWIRDIETKSEMPGGDLKKRLRRALETCPVHRSFGVKCNDKLPVPPDAELYAKRPLAPNEQT